MFKPSGEKVTPETQWKKGIDIQKDDAMLKKIVEKNFEKNFPREKRPRPDLIDNFHWVIMRVRRIKKLTQEQLAREISEPEAAIRMAEQGILPEGDYTLVKKIENFLGIVLIKEEKAKEKPESNPIKALTFKQENLKNFTIADLRRINEERKGMKTFSEFAVDFDDSEEDKDL